MPNLDRLISEIELAVAFGERDRALFAAAITMRRGLRKTNAWVRFERLGRLFAIKK